jgi:hypothetical protein
MMNSYSTELSRSDSSDSDRPRAPSTIFQEGDLLVHLQGCGSDAERDCEKEMRSYYEKWQREVQRLDGKQGP